MTVSAPGMGPERRRQNTKPGLSPRTLRDAEPDWYSEYLVAQGLSPKSIRVYKGHINRIGVWLAQRGLSLWSARPIHLAEYAESIPKSHATRVQLRCALKHWWDWQDLPSMDAAIRVPPAPRMVCRALEPGEARQLTKTAVEVGYPKGTAVLMGLYLALRRFEIAGARWDGFDAGLDWYTVTGKGDVTATIPVHPVLQRQLDDVERTSPFVFPGRKRVRQYVNAATVWTWTKEVAVEAGLDPVSTHRLRHTSLATANDNLGDLRAVQTFARHANPATTAGYTRTTAKRLLEVMRALDYQDDVD